jgi:hypothetical protein
MTRRGAVTPADKAKRAKGSVIVLRLAAVTSLRKRLRAMEQFILISVIDEMA